MSQHQVPSPRKRPWPDMSAYGLHFGVLDMPNGEPRMVMVDRDGAWAELAKRMGFSQSRWFGLYVKSSMKLDIPGFATNFPSAKVLQLSDQEIRDRVRPLILERRAQRLSQMAANRGRLSWHPNRTAAPHAPGAEDSAEESAAPISPQAALRQTLFLGMNALGQEVYESGDGMRFARSGEAIVSREAAETPPSATFLRASNDEDLVQVAAGLVREIVAGKRLHSDDFIRYIDAVYGAGANEDKELVARFHAAIDRAMLERLAAIEGAGQDVFTEALTLHEGRPSFWRAKGTLSTPLPVAVVMQSLAQARLQSADIGIEPTVIDITAHPKSHSWALAASSFSGGEIPAHDIALAGVFGQASRGQSVGGVRVTRTDTEALLASLAKRNPDGLSVFVVTTDKAGKMDNEFRRALSAIGQRYEVSGLVDLDPSLVGPGNEEASRLIVIGRKRAEPDYAFAVSADISILFDYAALWNWGETLRAAHLGETQTFGDDGREENRWQAPYIPASQISEPQAMSPRNLLGPVRQALAHIVDRNGMGVDEFVCAKLGWTMEQLEQRLDAEQADAVAIGIQAIDDGMGMVEADATGLGKGRVAATLAAYGKRKGMPVVFMTMTSDLFSDFYRDVQDIGCMAELGKPFIVNNDLIVRDSNTGAEITRSPKREQSQMTLACGDYPADHDLVLATYSQFNRKYDPHRAESSVRISRAIRSLLRGEQDEFAALMTVREDVGLRDYAALGVVDRAGALLHEQTQSAILRAAGDDAGAALHEDHATWLSRDRASLTAALADMVKTDLTTLKHQWLYSGALKGALLIIDESHAAAGESSQTGVNLRFLVEHAAAVAYSSATYAKDVNNFALYSRVFPSSLRVATIGETLARGGEPMQEVLSAMLAKDGRLVRREHDLSSLEFKFSVDASRKERNEHYANSFAQVLAAMSYLSGEVRDIADTMNEALAKAAPAKKVVKTAKAAKGTANAASGPGTASASAAKLMPQLGVQYTNFSSKFYNLTRTFMMAINADLAADLAIKALREGRKPVITVENTMETVLRELIEGVQLDDAVTDVQAAPHGSDPSNAAAADLAAADPLAALEAASAGQAPDAQDAAAGTKSRVKPPAEIPLGRRVSFRDILHAYVDTMFSASEQKRQGNRVISSKRIVLSNPTLLAAAAELHKVIDGMPEVPLSPMDLVRERIAAEGYSVDEISGRRLTLQLADDGTHKVVRMSERKKQPLKSAFNNGGLDALILSKSGATGISLHASRTFVDQSQRELIELQPAAAIDQRLQFWGRVNRKGQVCSPIVHMLSSGLPAELRLITMQNAKLRRMSANISGNADNSALNEDAPDILNRIGNEVCYRWMEANPKLSGIIGFNMADMEEQAYFGNTKFVDMLTGRLMMLDVASQRRVYQEITSEFKALIEQCELEGYNPLKSAEFDLRAKRTGTLVLQVASGLDSVFNESVTAAELTYPVSLNSLDRAEVEAAVHAGRSALIQAHGRKFSDVIAKACWSACEAALPSLLPKRLATVEDALAEERPNAVRNAANKYNWLAEQLPRLEPGSIVSFADVDVVSGAAASHGNFDDRFTESLFIVGWKIPETNKLSTAEYKLVGYSKRKRKKVELSLSALYTRPSRWIDCDYARDKPKSVQRDHERFFEVTGQALSGHESRIVLEGNLFRAAEIAEAQKAGATVTYSDERGVWHHAVLLPRTFTMRNVTHLPVTVADVDTLLAAFASRSNDDGMVIVTDDTRGGQPERSTYKVYGNANELFVTMPATDKSAWLLQNVAIKACLKNGDFQGSRTHFEGRVMPGHRQQFLESFVAAANSKGIKVLMEGHMRDWYNGYLQAKLGPTINQDSVDKALDDTQDEDLGALLATP